MTIAGVIAEFNPLHSGHAFFLHELKERGADLTAVVMSGNFVQRGDAAAFSKWARTKQALQCGADLVIELPLPWAVSGAEHFARGGTALLTALGADELCFGSECGCMEQLIKARNALSSPKLHDAMRDVLESGATFATARQKAVGNLFGEEISHLLSEPNNILGIEYLKAIDTLHSDLKPVTVQRRTSVHDDAEAGTQTKAASSAAIRRKISRGEPFADWMPEAAGQIAGEELKSGRAPASLLYVERAFLAQLRRMSRQDFACLPDISEGLENRICAAVQTAGSISGLYRSVKSKRYPMARIRRILLSAFLGMDASFGQGTPPYLRILGVTRSGVDILRKAKKNAVLPMIAKYSDRSRLDDRGRKILDLENRSTDLYSLCLPKAAPCGLDRSNKIVTL